MKKRLLSISLALLMTCGVLIATGQTAYAEDSTYIGITPLCTLGSMYVTGN